MSFDRTKPVNGTTVDADMRRGNMNDLDDRDGTTNARIDQTNAELAATNVRIDNLPVGVSFPYEGRAIWKPTRGLAARFADLMPLNITDENPNIQAIANRLDEYLARFQAM